MHDSYFCIANLVTASETMRKSGHANIIADVARTALSSGPGSLANRQSHIPLNNSLIIKMNITFSKIAGVAALAAISSIFVPTAGRTQTFSRAVVVMSGIVRSDESAKPTSVKVSIREAGDTAREITCSTSNSETGKYLVVLQPGKKYWVHIAGDSILEKDVLVETPNIGQSTQLKQDFSVVMRETEEATKFAAPPQQN